MSGRLLKWQKQKAPVESRPRVRRTKHPVSESSDAQEKGCAQVLGLKIFERQQLKVKTISRVNILEGNRLKVQQFDIQNRCAQVLWLFEDPTNGEHYATEVGAMNIFFAMEKPEGGLELCTAPLSKVW